MATIPNIQPLTVVNGAVDWKNLSIRDLSPNTFRDLYESVSKTSKVEWGKLKMEKPFMSKTVEEYKEEDLMVRIGKFLPAAAVMGENRTGAFNNGTWQTTAHDALILATSIIEDLLDELDRV